MEWSQEILARVNDTQIRGRLFNVRLGHSAYLQLFREFGTRCSLGLADSRGAAATSGGALMSLSQPNRPKTTPTAFAAALSCKCDQNQSQTWRQPNEEKATNTAGAPSPLRRKAQLIKL